MAQHVTHTVTRPQQATYTLTSPPTPGLDPPPGVIPNFHQPYTLLPYTELTIASCAIITTGLVAARIYVKAHLVKKYLWEDYTCILGWVGNCVSFSHIFLQASSIYDPQPMPSSLAQAARENDQPDRGRIDGVPTMR